MTEATTILPETDQSQSTTEAEKELNVLWQEYLQKCCEVGQLEHTLEQIESQKTDFEQKLCVTKRAVKSAAAKHKLLKETHLAAIKPATLPTREDH